MRGRERGSERRDSMRKNSYFCNEFFVFPRFFILLYFVCASISFFFVALLQQLNGDDELTNERMR